MRLYQTVLSPTTSRVPTLHEDAASYVKAGICSGSGLILFKQLSKADGRSNRDLQVVLSSTIEVNFVAGVGSNADGPEEELDSSTGIERAIQVSILETSWERPERNRSRSYSESNKAAFGKKKSTNR